MKASGLKPNVIMSSGTVSINEVQFAELLKDGCPEVVLASRDSIGISFMNVAVKKGYDVPRDLQVIVHILCFGSQLLVNLLVHHSPF